MSIDLNQLYNQQETASALGPFKPLKLNIWIPIILLLGQYLVAKFILEILQGLRVAQAAVTERWP